MVTLPFLNFYALHVVLFAEHIRAFFSTA